MFERIIGRVIIPKKVEWQSPEHLLIEDKSGEQEYKLLKGACEYIHKQVGIKPATSKEVNKLSTGIWKDLINIQLNQATDSPVENTKFSLEDNIVYIADNCNNIIDVAEVACKSDCLDLEDALEKFKLDVTTTERTKKFYFEGQGDTVRLICYSKDSVLPEEDYTPVVILEMNTTKSTYVIYTGVLIYDTFTLIPDSYSYLECNSYSQLIKCISISDVLEAANSKGEALYAAYKSFIEKPIEVSAREVLNILKKSGYKLELSDDDNIRDITNIGDPESNKRITSFFNTFKFSTGETALTILSLSEFRKIFRFNKLTLLDLLIILSKEYLSENISKICISDLSNIVCLLIGKQVDKLEADTIKHEVE